MQSLAGCVVVVSPHLDDAALSIGATIARAAREGATVRVLTVLAGDPSSAAPAGAWDRACGFRTAGEAARGRREEDRRACGILGAQPVWLPFGDRQYGRGGDEADVWAALEPELQSADVVFLPGFPLWHTDHAWVVELVLERLSGELRLGFYVEQPYAGREGRGRAEVLGRAVRWSEEAASFSHRRAKGRACRAYRSQFRGRRHLPRRLLVPELLWTPELLAWA